MVEMVGSWDLAVAMVVTVDDGGVVTVSIIIMIEVVRVVVIDSSGWQRLWLLIMVVMTEVASGYWW